MGFLNHVNNVRSALSKDDVQVEVVFFGPGLDMLLKKNPAYEERLKKLADSGVTLGLSERDATQESHHGRPLSVRDPGGLRRGGTCP